MVLGGVRGKGALFGWRPRKGNGNGQPDFGQGTGALGRMGLLLSVCSDDVLVWGLRMAVIACGVVEAGREDDGGGATAPPYCWARGPVPSKPTFGSSQAHEARTCTVRWASSPCSTNNPTCFYCLEERKGREMHRAVPCRP